MTKYTYSEWIEHDGKGMPVDGDVLVAVRFKDGEPGFDDSPIPASYWHNYEALASNWIAVPDDPYDDGFTISAYRIATPIND